MLLFLKCVFQSSHRGKARLRIFSEMNNSWRAAVCFARLYVISLCCVCVYIESIQHNEPLFFISEFSFLIQRNYLFMDDRIIEIKIYWWTLRIKSYLKWVRFLKKCSQHFNRLNHVWFDVNDDFTQHPRHHSPLTPRRFYLLSRVPFDQMERYTL